ncbi:MAG: WYL domain-containing protein [Candidatus Riflebacteria bacterium]|nr:WYL domain-containing protein [Candidatus Riflebacteria bacterium]
MAGPQVFRRYSLILTKILGDRFPSLETIAQFLRNSRIDSSVRTIQRDLEALRDTFGIGITWDRATNGYYIDEANTVNPNHFLRFLELTCLGQMLFESVSAGKAALACLSFGTSGTLAGQEFIPRLLTAIRTKAWVTFTHRGFLKDKPREVKVAPLLLREYLGRWYLVSAFEPGEKLYSYGLDRMSDLKVLRERFTIPAGTNPAAIFDKTIGVYHSDEDPERIVLAFDQDQAVYLKSQPLHASQRILREDKEECVIELEVIPNFELQQRILMYGFSVKVLEPAWLAVEIRDILREAAERYAPPTPAKPKK